MLQNIQSFWNGFIFFLPSIIKLMNDYVFWSQILMPNHSAAFLILNKSKTMHTAVKL